MQNTFPKVVMNFVKSQTLPINTEHKKDQVQTDLYPYYLLQYSSV